MEKIGLCRNDGKPIIGRIEHDEAVLKVNEIVDEINTCYSILLKVQDWIVKHEKHSQKE